MAVGRSRNAANPLKSKSISISAGRLNLSTLYSPNFGLDKIYQYSHIEPCRISLCYGSDLRGATSRLFLRMRAELRGSNCGASSRGWNRTTGSRCPPSDPASTKSASTLDSSIESSMWPNSRRASTYSMPLRSEPENHRNASWNSLETGFVPWS